MADTLLIHYSPDKPEQATWSTVNADGALTTKLCHGKLADVADIAKQHKVVMLLDSNYIHINNVQIPTKNKQKLLHAAPFALEEQLADEIEDLHFVIANNSIDNTTAVACIKKDTLDEILKRFIEAGITLNTLLPDSLCLSTDTNQWAVLLFNESALFQQNPLSATSIERDYFKTVLSHTLNNTDINAPEKIILFQVADEECEDINDTRCGEAEIIPVSFNDNPLVIFCENYKQALPLNLLQHDYKPVSKNTTQYKRWRLATALSFFWLTIHLGNIAYQSNQLETQNKELRTKINQIYKKSFPKSKKIVNARVQMEQKLKQLRTNGSGGSTGLISLLGDSHKAFTSNKDVTINAINYRNNSMDITVTSTNLKSVEQINKALDNKLLQSEIISSTSEKDIVKGELRIKRPKS